MRVKVLRYAASVAAVVAVVAVYRIVLEVNQTTVALTLLLVILGISARRSLSLMSSHNWCSRRAACNDSVNASFSFRYDRAKR